MSKWIIASLSAVLTLALAMVTWGFHTSERVTITETVMEQHKGLEVHTGASGRLRAIEWQLAVQTEQIKGLGEKIDELRGDIRGLR